MTTPAQLAIRRGTAEDIINANAAELAALAGLPPLEIHAKLWPDDVQTTELLELLARIVAAIAATNP